MIELFVFIFVFSFVGIIIFLCLVVPIMAIIRCVENPSVSRNARIAWIVMMIIFWPFTAYVYYAIYARSLTVKVFSIIIIVMLLGGIGISTIFDSRLEQLMDKVERDFGEAEKPASNPARI